MTKEEKELLLKDIFARLPYDLIVQETFQKAKGDSHVWDCGPHYIKDHPEKVKPYLRPLSSMTEEELEELNCLCYHNISIQDNRICGYICGGELEDVIDWLNKKHFDYRGLIPKELALEALEDMYV